MENSPIPPGQEPDPILDAIENVMGTMGRPDTNQVEYLGRTLLGLNGLPDSPDVDPQTLAAEARAADIVRANAEKFNSDDPTEVAEASRMFKLMLDARVAMDQGRLGSFDPNSHDRFLEDPLSGAEVREGLGAIAGMLDGDVADLVREHTGMSTAEPNPQGAATIFEHDEHGVVSLILGIWLGLADKVEESKQLITPSLLMGGEKTKQMIMQAVLEDDNFAAGTQIRKREIVERLWEKLPLVFQAAIQIQRAKKARFRQQMDEM